jgi:hypothetical protein
MDGGMLGLFEPVEMWADGNVPDYFVGVNKMVQFGQAPIAEKIREERRSSGF